MDKKNSKSLLERRLYNQSEFGLINVKDALKIFNSDKNTSTKKVTPAQLQEQFEKHQREEQGISWFNKEQSGRYLNEYLQSTWKGFLDCAKLYNILEDK